jgi:glutathione S-transferase
LRRAPKGKLPYIEDDGTIVADSTFIRLHLEERHGIDFDPGLGAAERGLAWAVEKMCEDHLYWAMVRWRWLDERNFAAGPAKFFDRAPAPVRPLAIRFVKGRVRRTLRAHGLGRHSDDELARLSARAIDGIAAQLDDKPYFMGPLPAGVDATIFAFVAGTLCPVFEMPMRRQMEQHANLVAYRDRLMREFFPDFAT